MDAAGQRLAVCRSEAGEVGLHMRAAALDLPAGQVERPFGWAILGIEALGILNPCRGEALEPGVDVVVIGTFAPR